MLAPWKKSYEKPTQHFKKQYHFADKDHMVKAMVFPVVMYGCESWAKRSLSAKELMFSNCGARKDS